ncbi:hypothetical protein MTO96_050943 [Rhipicephalus appendiculatus]
MEDAVPRVDKAVVVSRTLTVSVSANGRLVPSAVYAKNKNVDVKTVQEFQCLLGYVGKLKCCEGCPTKLYPSISKSSVATQDGNTWRRNTCETLSLNSPCHECKLLGKLFSQRTNRQKHRKPRQKSTQVKTLRRKAIRATLKREKARKDILLMKKQLRTLSDSKINEVLQILPKKQQLVFKTAFMAAKAKSKLGRRYEQEWLMTCLLLQIASSKAYSSISDMQLLPLPTKARLRQIITGIPCKYGYNQVALRCIEEYLNDKSHLRRCGVLLVDEIKLKQAIAFNKASYKMDGFVDYGDEQATGMDQLADHGLVLMFVPLFEDWVQPIATFATKGAAPGKVLSDLVISAVIQLHNHGAFVLAVISDGAGNNRSMWSQLGISGKLDSACHFIEHPLEPSQNIYFICDIPHVIRCIRNHLKKHTYGMVIKDFLALLNTTERNAVCSGLKLFASQMTTEAMRVTLLSTLDIIEYLFGLGAHYILTAKLNQDPLERHFGLVRSFGGDESHPTVVNFTQIFRLLSLYTPIKTVLRGSVEGAPSAVLVGVQDTLRRTNKDGSLNKAKLRDLIEVRMRDLTKGPGDSHQHEDSDHADFKGDVDESILYYLSGYVVHKFTKTTTCSSCISSTEPFVGKDAYLTIYRSFKEGCMKHPSRKMLHFVNIVNRAVSHSLSGDQVTSDIFWDVLDELEMENIDRLGCVAHEAAFTCQVLNFIIVTRMHFYTRDVNRRLENSEKAAVANKKARLL